MARSNAETRRNLEATFIASFSLLTLVMGFGMAFSIHRFESEADTQVVRIRAEEDEITEVERLRWIASSIVSSGRGHLIAGDPSLLVAIRQTRAEFQRALDDLLSDDPSPQGRELAQDVDRAAQRFLGVQQELLDARREGAAADVLARRFEQELLPLSKEFDSALTHLVDHKERLMLEHYVQAKNERSGLARRLYGLLGALVLASIVAAWLISRRLGLAFKREQEAVRSAEKAITARDELMGIVAHDLRNPLAVITLKASMMRRSADSDRAREQAHAMERVARRMESLISTMLDVSMLEAGRFTVDVARCSLSELLRETADSFGPLAAAKEVRFEQTAREPGLALLIDRERVLQVLSNLIENALKFTPPGGEVTLSVEREGSMARFAVVDTGRGIARQNLVQIFDRFWTRASGSKGTGLGLFIAKGIVEAHGGRIWADSEPGRGATVFFTLPLTSGAGQESTALQPHPA
jgi:signal transduction histidine kinase